jgi:hypothetical protein
VWIEKVEKPAPSATRKSSRAATVQNKQEMELKLKEYEERRAALPKREKIVVERMTQEELLAEAKITEQLNLASLQAFKQMEAEKKKVLKKKEGIIGPYIRYHSFPEKIATGKPVIQVLAEKRNIGNEKPSTTGAAVQGQAGKRKVLKLDPKKVCARNMVTFIGFSEDDFPLEYWDLQEPCKYLSPGYIAKKNCLTSERAVDPEPPRPICPITGLPAKYRDPKTGVPYANIEAYKILQQVAQHKFVWSELLSAYCQRADQLAANRTPTGFRTVAAGEAYEEAIAESARERRRGVMGVERMEL